ncbi:hypothetical protein ACTFIW_003829 [Dictyostelium discoideum]
MRDCSRSNTKDSVLMKLLDNRTYFHSQSYGELESLAYEAIKWFEDTFMKHPEFVLPGLKELFKKVMLHMIKNSSGNTWIDRLQLPRASEVVFQYENAKEEE